MKILFDHQIFENQKFGGISRYFFELLFNFNKSNRVNWDLALKYSANAYLQMLPRVQDTLATAPPDFYKEFLGGIDFPGKGRLFEIYKKFNPAKQLKYNIQIATEAVAADEFDIFHPTYYNDYFLDYIGSKPFVLTVHDMIHEIFPEYFLGDKISVQKHKLVQRAHKIIAISESTKNDLVTFWGVDPEKIVVIYHGNSLNPNFIGVLPDNITLPERYFLYVGERGYYKNFYFFMQAISPILKEDKTLRIVCTGRKFTEEEEAFLGNLGLLNKLLHFFVNDTLLAQLYQKALAFVFPSLYEGFGIPILEAFSCGCPVLASNNSSLPEVGGEAALYFDPKNAGAIQEAVRSVIRNEHIRVEMRQAGYKQLEKFSWENTALATEAVYKSILS